MQSGIYGGNDTNTDRQIPIAHSPTAHLPIGTFTDRSFADRDIYRPGHLPTGTFTDQLEFWQALA